MRMCRRIPVDWTPGFVSVVLGFLCKEALYVQSHRSFVLRSRGACVGSENARGA